MNRRRITLASAAIGGLFAAILILASSGGRVERMTYGDGRFYLYVAQHMDSSPSELDPLVAQRGPSVRYGRIALPALVWTLSAGRPAAMPYIQPVVMVLAAAAIAAAASQMIDGLAVKAALIPFLAVGLTLAIAGGYGEPVAAAAGAWAIVFCAKGRWGAAAVLLAVAMLGRENAAAFLVGLFAWALAKRNVKAAVILGCSILPVIAWHAVVRARFGSWPALDPYWAQIGARDLPLESIVSAIRTGSWAVKATAAAHLGMAAALIGRWRASPFSAAAAGTALQVAIIPALTWSYLGDAFRTFAFLELMTVLSIAAVMITRLRARARSTA